MNCLLSYPAGFSFQDMEYMYKWIVFFEHTSVFTFILVMSSIHLSVLYMNPFSRFVWGFCLLSNSRGLLISFCLLNYGRGLLITGLTPRGFNNTHRFVIMKPSVYTVFLFTQPSRTWDGGWMTAVTAFWALSVSHVVNLYVIADINVYQHLSGLHVL